MGFEAHMSAAAAATMEKDCSGKAVTASLFRPAARLRAAEAYADDEEVEF